MTFKEKQYMQRLEFSHNQWKKMASIAMQAGADHAGDILCGQAFTLGQRIIAHQKMHAQAFGAGADEWSFHAGALCALEIWAEELLKTEIE